MYNLLAVNCSFYFLFWCISTKNVPNIRNNMNSLLIKDNALEIHISKDLHKGGLIYNSARKFPLRLIGVSASRINIQD